MLRQASPYVALFLSGLAALIYQTAWGRMLQRVFGVSDLAIATVLATFFLGLGLGSALGGRWGTRNGRPARLYAVLEVVIGAWALASILLIPNVHGLYASIGSDQSFATLTALRFTLALLILLPPTLLMGATLPVLIAAVSRQGVDWGARATGLYATNTLGAVAGAGLTGLLLVPRFGARVSILVAAAASFAAAAVVFATMRALERTPIRDEAGGEDGAEPADPAPQAERGEDASGGHGTLPLATGLAFVAGLASLASEVLWTRVLRMIVQGTTQAFAAMLVNFLLGIALGSLLADRLVRRGADARRLFGVTQLLLLLLTGVAMAVAPQLPRVLAMAQDGASLVPHEAGPILLLASLLLLPLALVLGTSVPLAWRIAGGSAEQAARHSGRVLAANTIGGLLGSLAAGFLLVPSIGIEASLLVVALVHGIASMIALTSSAGGARSRVGGVLVPALALAGLMTMQPRLHLGYLVEARRDIPRAVIEGPSEDWRQGLVFLEEGRNTTVTVSQRAPGSLQLFNDGRPESGLSAGRPGFGAELVLLGSLPNFFVPERGDALVVGLGGGHSTSVLAEPGWGSVEVVELEEAVVHAARFMHESFDAPFPLDRPEVTLTVDDARAQLVLSPPESLDAVVSQPSHPWLAGSSALYTEEFFQEVQRALRPHGVFSLWVNRFRIEERHLKSVVATLLAVFDHVQAFVVEYSSFVLAASDTPLTTTAARFEELGREGSYLGAIEMDQRGFVGALELDTAGARAWTVGAERIVDDRPTLEFELARLPEDRDLSTEALDAALLEVPWASPETLAQLGLDPLEGALARVDGVRDRRLALDRLARTIPELGLAPGTDQALVEAVLAEARGDFATALRRYDDAMASPEAVRRMDALRDAERLHAGLLRRLQRPGRAAPPDIEPYVIAALAENDRATAEALLSDHPGWASPLRPFAEAWAGADCEAALGHAASLSDDRTLHAAARCASEVGRFETASDLLARAGRARRLTSHRWTTRAIPMLSTNTGLAVRYLMRALAATPGHAKAAEELAKALHAHGEPERAASVLEVAIEHNEGLPAAAHLYTVAERLGVHRALVRPPDVREPLRVRP